MFHTALILVDTILCNFIVYFCKTALNRHNATYNQIVGLQTTVLFDRKLGSHGLQSRCQDQTDNSLRLFAFSAFDLHRTPLRPTYLISMYSCIK